MVDTVARTSAKVAIIAAAEDKIVPPRQTAALRGASDEIVLDRVIASVGHNDIYDSEEFTGAMRKALLLLEEQVRSGR